MPVTRSIPSASNLYLALIALLENYDGSLDR
jgi:hypothetical protein